jgi:hypothetical protein
MVAAVVVVGVFFLPVVVVAWRGLASFTQLHTVLYIRY